MKITKLQEGTSLTVAPEGRLDTLTAPELENVFKTGLDGIETLTLNFEKLDYISSAGLRVLLSAQKTMNAQGSMKITHANEIVREIFDVTGFSDILTVE